MRTARVQQTDFGTNEIGIPTYSNGCWTRIDVYRPKDGSKPIYERRFCSGRSDQSDMATGCNGNHYKGNAQYNPECSCCWLGFSHTLDLHNLALYED